MSRVPPYNVPGVKRPRLGHSLAARSRPRAQTNNRLLFMGLSNKPLLFSIKKISLEWKYIFVWNPGSQSLQLAPTDTATFHRRCVHSTSDGEFLLFMTPGPHSQALLQNRISSEPGGTTCELEWLLCAPGPRLDLKVNIIYARIKSL